MSILSDWRMWWRAHETAIYALLVIFPTVWLESPQLQALLPAALVSKIAPFIGGLGLALKVWDKLRSRQPPAPPPSNDFHQGDA